MAPKLPSSLGLPVSTRDFSLSEMVQRAWGSEFFAPDHRIYSFGGVRFFDSTDIGFTGIYSPGTSQVSAFTLSSTSDPINPTAIDLTWTLATIYGDEIDYYQIYRSVNGGAFTLLISFSAIQPGFSPNYIDSRLNPANTYSYYVVAIADVGSTPGGGSAGPSTSRSNTVSVAQATAPVLSGVLVGTTKVDLTWTAATVPSSTIGNYFVYREVDGGGFALLTTTAGNVLAFNDLTVSTGHTYQYYVVAQPVSGFLSLQSNIVTETISSTVIFQITSIGTGSTGPSFNGPGQTYYGGASSFVVTTPSGFTGGSLSPDPVVIGGHVVAAFGQMAAAPGVVSPTGNSFVLILNAPGLPQNLFTAIDFTLSDATVWHLTSASALFNNPWDDTALGYTTWVWPSTEPFFPPPSWPSNIVVS